MSASRPEISLYKRAAAHITHAAVLHPEEKALLLKRAPIRGRKEHRAQLEADWDSLEREAKGEASVVLDSLRTAASALIKSLDELDSLRLPELLGKVEDERQRVRQAATSIESATAALDRDDFRAAGEDAEEASRALFMVRGPLIVVLNNLLLKAPLPKVMRERVQANSEARKRAQTELQRARKERPGPDALLAAATSYRLAADRFSLVAEALGSRRFPERDIKKTKIGREGELRVLQPTELETFSDVGGLDEVKAQLRATIGSILERPDDAAKYRVVHNGVLFYGPPGTGKTMLSRALAGEYGLRYIRFNPASIASAYIHEAAANLQKMFELAAAHVPCVLFLDEVDSIASSRDDEHSADHREVVTQLMNALEEYRLVPGLVIMAATNNIDRLDAGLREGRFDSKIYVPMPDPQGREEIFAAQLEKRPDAVAWDTIDLTELSRLTANRNAAAIEGFVSLASQYAMNDQVVIDQSVLVKVIKDRGGKDRLSLEKPIDWEDVVIEDDVKEELFEILNVFDAPELARSIGVRAPAGLLLYGPPGTGKTTIARAIASQLEASFYEQSAAELLSKWAGESEERVAKLFTKARANRPSVIFIDEIDSLLRTRGAEGSANWEERVVAQFLKELDGLKESEGVLLVGATNRIDIIDAAIYGRRLTPIEVGLPTGPARLQLLKVLSKGINLSAEVNLRNLASSTQGMSGADLRRLLDTAGRKALSRTMRFEDASTQVTAEVSADDIQAALDLLRRRATLVEV